MPSASSAAFAGSVWITSSSSTNAISNGFSVIISPITTNGARTDPWRWIPPMVDLSTRQRTRAFSGLQSHYLFEDRYGRSGKGNDKGKVEGLVGYARRNFMAPLPRFESWDAFNADLEDDAANGKATSCAATARLSALGSSAIGRS